MIPTSKEAMIPVLECLEKGPKTSMELRQAMIERFNITEDEQNQKQQRGTTFLYVNRIGWALTGLKEFGYIQSPERGLWEIKPDGITALKNPPNKIVAKPKIAEVDDSTVPSPVKDESYVDYLDKLTDDYNEYTGILKKDLLKKLKFLDQSLSDQQRGSRLELIVRELFEKMGYTTKLTPSTRDKGVDIVLSDDRLNLNQVFVQVKCYTDTNVNSEDIQRLKGYSSNIIGSKCVFVTTTDFTGPAQEEAKKGNFPVLLINGDRLVELMLEYGLGIVQNNEFNIYEPDDDFFSKYK